MRNLTRLIIAALASYPILVSAQAQPTVAPVDSYQLRYQSNLQTGDGVVILTPTPAASPAAKASVAPVTNPPTIDKNVPIEGPQVNKAPTGTGTTTFGKNITIEGSQANKNSTGTGTGPTTTKPSKNVTILDSRASSNTTGVTSHTATAARINSKRDVTNNVQSGDERNKKKKQKQQLQEAESDNQPMDRGDESRKKQKQQRQLQPNQPPE